MPKRDAVPLIVRITFLSFDESRGVASLAVSTESGSQRNRTTLEAAVGQLIASDQGPEVAAALRGVRLVEVRQMGSRAAIMLRRDSTNTQVTIPANATFNLGALPSKRRGARELIGTIALEDGISELPQPPNFLPAML